MNVSSKISMLVAGGNKFRCENLLFILIESTSLWNICPMYFIFEEKWPGYKTISYFKSYCVIYLFIQFLSHFTFCSFFLHLHDSTWSLKDILIIDICIFLLNRKRPHCSKNILHDLVMFSIYYIEEINVSQEKTSVIILVCKEKQHSCEKYLL